MTISLYLLFLCLILTNETENSIPIDIEPDIKYVGLNNHYNIPFDGPNPVPNGVAYNSYVILDEKVIVIDGLPIFHLKEWLENIEKVLNGRKIDYILIHHAEPDHSGTLLKFLEKYPKVTVISSLKCFHQLKKFFGTNFSSNRIVVKEGDEINLGKHTLHFIEAPMIHWPEVIFSYDSYSKILFSCDAFGNFGSNDIKQSWDDESRRYYFGIVGRYGIHVQSVLKKVSKLDIKMILPAHGTILNKNLDHYIKLYDTWSKYVPEEEGVCIAYVSIYGNTKKVVDIVADKLKSVNVKVVVHDLANTHWTKVLADAFKFNKLVLASITYDDELFTPMDEFVEFLNTFLYQSRVVGLIENGSWNPITNKIVKNKMKNLKNIKFLNKSITLKSSINSIDVSQLNEFVDELVKTKI